MRSNLYMKIFQPVITVAFSALCNFLFFSSASALVITDISAEVLFRQVGEIKKELNLNANQEILWKSTELKVREILRARQIRRGRLQESAKFDVANPLFDLRDLATKFSAEEEIAVGENKQLRELCLIVNDALDDRQRQLVLKLISEELERVSDTPRESAQPRSHEEGNGRGMPKRKSGGIGGMGNMGGMGGDN